MKSVQEKIDQEALNDSYKKVDYKLEVFEKYSPMVPGWIERGKEFIYPQKMPKWAELVISSLNSEPVLIEYALAVMDMVNSGVPYADAYASLRDTVSPDYTYDVTMIVANYSKQGVDFIKAVDPEHYNYHKKHFDGLESENFVCQAALGN